MVLGEPAGAAGRITSPGTTGNWGELVQIDDDQDIFQASPDGLPAINIRHRSLPVPRPSQRSPLLLP